MATVTADDRTTFPAVVTQSYGRGRVLAVMVGDLWRWGLQRPADAENDLAKAWRQMVRWLVADVPHRLEGAVPEQEGTHQTVRLEIAVAGRGVSTAGQRQSHRAGSPAGRSADRG